MNSIADSEIIIEAVLFASGDPVSLDKLADIIDYDKNTTRGILSNLINKYQSSSRGIMLMEIDGSYQLCTKPEFDKHIIKLGAVRKKQSLTSAAYETLSIIAYKQPVTRAQIEQIRGVNSDGIVQKLLERDIITEAGRDDTLGRPMLFKTTEEFLRIFGYSSIKDLPALEMNDVQEVMEDVPLD